MKFKAKVLVYLKKSILDAQGNTTLHALKKIGFALAASRASANAASDPTRLSPYRAGRSKTVAQRGLQCPPFVSAR